MKDPPVDRSARDWVSTAHKDYVSATSEPIEDLGTSFHCPPFEQTVGSVLTAFFYSYLLDSGWVGSRCVALDWVAIFPNECCNLRRLH
jgi:hypothetical protein